MGSQHSRSPNIRGLSAIVEIRHGAWQLMSGRDIKPDGDKAPGAPAHPVRTSNLHVIQFDADHSVIRETEDRLRLLLDSTAEGIFGIDIEARCTFCNAAALRVLGHGSADQLIGKNMHALIHHTRPDGLPYPAEDCPILQALHGGQGAHIDDEVLWKADGTSFHAEYWSNPQRRDGKVVGAVVAFLDITHRRRATRALEISEQKFSKAFHQSPIAMTVTSAKDHSYIDVNDRFEDLSGYSRGEVIGRTPFDIGIWVNPKQRIELIQRLLTEHNLRNVEVKFRRKNASIGDGIGSMALVELEAGPVVVSAIQDITDRNRALEELKNSEDKFRTIFHDAPTAVVMLSEEGRLLAVNQAFCDFIGYKEEELLGQSIVSITHPDDRENSRIRLSEILEAKNESRRLEKRYINKDGQVRWGEVSSSLIRKSAADRFCIVSHIVDITDRRKAEHELRESENRFRTVFRDAPEAMGVTDMQGHYLSANKAFCDFLGYTEEELLSADIVSVTHPADQPGTLERLRTISEGPPTIRIQKRYVHKNGEVRWGDLSRSVIHGVDGKPAFMVAQIVDITERKRMEQELRDAEEKFAKAFQCSPNPFTISTLKDDIYIDVNTAFEVKTGYRRDEVIGRTVAELGIWENYAERGKLAELIVRGEPIRNVECRFRKKSGEIFVALLSAELMELERETCIVANTIDITEWRRTQGELSEAQRVARLGSWTDDRDGVLIWSDEMYRIHGRDPSLAPPSFEELEQFFAPESWQRLKATREKAWHSGSIPSEDLEIVRPDGSHGWIATRGEVERDSSGLIVRLRGTAQDITERKRAEQRLREYEQAVEGAEEMIAVVDREYRYVIANRAFLEQRKMSPDQVIGRRVDEIIEKQLFETSIKPRLDESFLGNTVQFQMKYSYSDGKEEDLFISYLPIQGLTGIERIVCILQDITERRKQQEALRLSEERFRRVVEHIGDALIVDDAGGKVVFANDRFQQLFGFSREELPSTILEDYVAPEYRAELRDRHDRRIRGEAVPTHFEYEGLRRDGARMWLEVDVVPIKDPQGKITGTQSALRDITLRKRMESELRRSESDLRQAQRIATVGSWTWNPETDAVTWSDELRNMVGWDPMLPIPSFSEHKQFFDADSWLRLNEAVQNTLATGEPYEVDTEAIRSDGSKGWFTNRGELVRDDFGRVIHLRGTVQDVTQRKLAECALRENEERYRGLVESSHDWIWEVDADAKYTYAGPQCRRILGYESEEIVGKKPFDFMSADEGVRVRQEFEAIAKQRKPFRSLENINLHKAGHRVVLETNGTPIFNQNGELIGYRGMDRDITRRKRAEEALRQSERKFATLFRTAPVAIGLTTLDGTFIDVNDSFETVTGYTRDQAIGSTATDIGLWTDPNERERLREKLLIERGLHDVEHSFRTKGGEIRNGLLSTEMIDIQGETYVLTVVQDLTEQKRAEKIQRDLSGRLIRAQEEERKRIARELHDDINQRLALVAIQLQQLQGSAGQRKKQLEKLFKETTAITSDIQTLSHQLHSSSLEYLGLVPAIQHFCDELRRKHKLTISFTHTGVPASLSPEIDLALFRITQEALHNAVKYSGVKHFEISLVAVPEEVELIVRDSGVGFGPEAAMQGRGLGLISMRERIAPFKGSISIISKPGKGTEITARIPWQGSDQSQ